MNHRSFRRVLRPAASHTPHSASRSTDSPHAHSRTPHRHSATTRPGTTRPSSSTNSSRGFAAAVTISRVPRSYSTSNSVMKPPYDLTPITAHDRHAAYDNVLEAGGQCDVVGGAQWSIAQLVEVEHCRPACPPASPSMNRPIITVHLLRLHRLALSQPLPDGRQPLVCRRVKRVVVHAVVDCTEQAVVLAVLHAQHLARPCAARR